MTVQKVSKESANYRGGGDHCGMCEYWIEGRTEIGKCKKVEGDIGEDMLCDWFERTSKETPGYIANTVTKRLRK